MSNQLITKTYNDLTFTFRADGYFNMTKAAQHFGKKLSHFQDSAETTEYLDALSGLTGLAPRNSGSKVGVWWSSYFGQFDKFDSCRLMLESNG